MNYAILKAEIQNDPASLGYAGKVDGEIAALINDPRFPRHVEVVVDARRLMGELGPEMAASIMDKLETAAAANSAVKWAVQFFAGGGIDIGHPATRAMLDQLVVAGILTAAEAEAVKALAVPEMVSRCAILGLPAVSAQMVGDALRGGY